MRSTPARRSSSPMEHPWSGPRGGEPIPLPERVAGSDLIFELCDLAARKAYRLFFAGGAPGVAELAARRLTERFPGLQVVGTASPSFRDFSTAEYDKLKAQIGAGAASHLDRGGHHAPGGTLAGKPSRRPWGCRWE